MGHRLGLPPKITGTFEEWIVSSFGVPARTTMPISDLTSSTPLPGTILLPSPARRTSMCTILCWISTPSVNSRTMSAFQYWFQPVEGCAKQNLRRAHKLHQRSPPCRPGERTVQTSLCHFPSQAQPNLRNKCNLSSKDQAPGSPWPFAFRSQPSKGLYDEARRFDNNNGFVKMLALV